jgi:hypothetical protein
MQTCYQHLLPSPRSLCAPKCSSGRVSGVPLSLTFLGTFFWNLLRKMVCGGMVFLLEIFEFLVCFVVVNRGEVMVGCVAKVVC